MQKNVVWVTAAVAALVIAGAAFFVGRLAAMPKESPPVASQEPTQEEKERQRIVVAASEGKLVEATPTESGWIVRFEQEAAGLSQDGLLKQAHAFFHDLNRTGVQVARTSFEARSNALRDVWGNPLSDVPVLRIQLSKDTFSRINWQGFEPQHFSRVADDFWLHDVIRQKKTEQAQGGQGGEQGGEQSGQGE